MLIFFHIGHIHTLSIVLVVGYSNTYGNTYRLYKSKDQLEYDANISLSLTNY